MIEVIDNIEYLPENSDVNRARNKEYRKIAIGIKEKIRYVDTHEMSAFIIITGTLIKNVDETDFDVRIKGDKELVIKLNSILKP